MKILGQRKYQQLWEEWWTTEKARKGADVGYTERPTGQQRGPFSLSPQWVQYNRMLVHILGRAQVRLSRTHGENYLSTQGGVILVFLISNISTSNQIQVFTCKPKLQEKVTVTWSLTPTLIQGAGGGGTWNSSGRGTKDLVSCSPLQTQVNGDSLGIPTVLRERGLGVQEWQSGWEGPFSDTQDNLQLWIHLREWGAQSDADCKQNCQKLGREWSREGCQSHIGF